MKKKNMIMVGLLVLVCVLFLAVGYATITKSITGTFSVGGKADSNNFVIGFGDLNKMNQNGLDAFIFNSSNSYYDQTGVFSTDGSKSKIIEFVPGEYIDNEKMVTESFTLSARGLNAKGEKVGFLVPVVNLSNDLVATNVTVTPNSGSGKAIYSEANDEVGTKRPDTVDCNKYYKFSVYLKRIENGTKIDGKVVKVDNMSNSIITGAAIVSKPYHLLPHSTFSEAINAWYDEDPKKDGKNTTYYYHDLFFLKVEIETLHTLLEDTSYTNDNTEINYCTWNVSISADAMPMFDKK